MADLKSFSVAELLKLRIDVDVMLESKRDELNEQLREIGGDVPGKRGRPLRGGSKRSGSKVAAKYRHPKTGQEWSGRGGTVGWLAAEIEAGKKKEDFLIATASRKSAVKRSKTKNSS